jgi:hypothetical protein
VTCGRPTRQVGQGALAPRCSTHAYSSMKASFFIIVRPFYRALAHIFASKVAHRHIQRLILSSTFSYLQRLPRCLLWLHTGILSTHLFSSSYRASTHLSTVLPPTLFGVSCRSQGRLALRYCSPYTRPLSFGIIDTVLSPTFSPFFQSPLYRSFNHRPTVTLPTKNSTATVLSPTKLSSNHLNSHLTRVGKDVLKTCLKKTSRLMMFFNLNFFSADRRHTTP